MNKPSAELIDVPGVCGSDKPFSPESKYNRAITGMDGVKTTVDVYRVLVAFSVTAPEIQHAIKKLLCAGIRGKGNEDQDLSESIVSIQKYQERKRQEGYDHATST